MTDDPLKVELGDRSYDIRFYQSAPDAIARDIKPFCPERVLIVSNDAVWSRHGEALQGALSKQGIQADIELIGDGERFKSLDSTSKVYDRLIKERYARK